MKHQLGKKRLKHTKNISHLSKHIIAAALWIRNNIILCTITQKKNNKAYISKNR